MRKPKKSQILIADTPPVYGDNSDEEYLDIVWGVLRVPVECTKCHRKTHTPYPTEEGNKCPECYRMEMYGF